MSKRDLAEVLFKVVGIIGLALLVKDIPSTYVLFSGAFDSTAIASRHSLLIMTTLSMSTLLVLSLIMIFFGSQIAKILFDARVLDGSSAELMRPNKENYRFIVQLIGTFIVYHALPTLVKNTVEGLMLATLSITGSYNMRPLQKAVMVRIKEYGRSLKQGKVIDPVRALSVRAQLWGLPVY